MTIQVKRDVAEVNGTRLYYEQAGSGQAVVLVHGGGGDRRYWDGQFLTLAEGFQVIRYDLRGYGNSAAPVEKQPYRHEDDLKALLGALNIAKAHIAGYSLGCQVTVDAYTAYPELFRSIIAVGPYVSGHNSAASKHLFGGYGECGAVFQQAGQRAAAESFVNIPAFNPDRIGAKAKARVAEICSEFSWWFVDHDDPLQPVEPAAAENLRDINVPLLVVSAEYDAAVCHEIADLLEREVPCQKRVDISGASHFMLIEKPAEFNEIVASFLHEVQGLNSGGDD